MTTRTAAVLDRIDALQRRDASTVHRLVGAVADAEPGLLERLLDRYEAEAELEAAL